MATAVPISTQKDGGIKYSDGSIKYSSGIGATGTGTGGYPTYPTAGQIGGASTNTPYKPPVQNKQSTGGSGGSGSSATSTQQSTMPQVNMPTGINDQMSKEIDSTYNGSMDYLNQAENNLRSDLPNVLQSAQSAYDANLATLGTQKSAADNTFNSQQTQAQKKKENALAAARQQLQELNQSSQARFGGGSTAGQASSEILGREFMKQSGQNEQQFGDTVNQINTARKQTEDEYNAGVMNLKKQKDDAIAQANRDFQSKLLDIANNRRLAGEAKSQMKLQALQQLQQNVFAITQQTQQFQQTLEAQKQQAQLEIQKYNATTGSRTQSGQGALDNYNAIIDLNKENGQPKQAFTLNQPAYVGAIKKSIVGRDELGRNIYDDGTRGYTQYY